MRPLQLSNLYLFLVLEEVLRRLAQEQRLALLNSLVSIVLAETMADIFEEVFIEAI